MRRKPTVTELSERRKLKAVVRLAEAGTNRRRDKATAATRIAGRTIGRTRVVNLVDNSLVGLITKLLISLVPLVSGIFVSVDAVTSNVHNVQTISRLAVACICRRFVHLSKS